MQLLSLFVLIFSIYQLNGSDPCTESAQFGFLIETVNAFDSMKSLFKFPVNLYQRALDFETPTICDVMKILNEIKDKLNKMHNNEFEIKCEIHRSQFVTKIHEPIQHHFENIKAFLTLKSDAIRQRMISLCLDNVKGVTSLYSIMKTYFQDGFIKYAIKDCMKYRSDKIDEYFYYYATIAAKIQTIYIACVEAANDDEPMMDYISYNNQLFELFEYYRYWTKAQFVKDTSELGMKQVIQKKLDSSAQILNGISDKLVGTNQKLINELNSEYGYYKWDVLIDEYNNGENGHTIDWYGERQSLTCGNLFYEFKDKGQWTVSYTVSYYEKESQLEYDLAMGFPYIRSEKNVQIRKVLSNLGVNLYTMIANRKLDKEKLRREVWNTLGVHKEICLLYTIDSKDCTIPVKYGKDYSVRSSINNIITYNFRNDKYRYSPSNDIFCQYTYSITLGVADMKTPRCEILMKPIDAFIYFTAHERTNTKKIDKTKNINTIPISVNYNLSAIWEDKNNKWERTIIKPAKNLLWYEYSNGRRIKEFELVNIDIKTKQVVLKDVCAHLDSVPVKYVKLTSFGLFWGYEEPNILGYYGTWKSFI